MHDVARRYGFESDEHKTAREKLGFYLSRKALAEHRSVFQFCKAHKLNYTLTARILRGESKWASPNVMHIVNAIAPLATLNNGN